MKARKIIAVILAAVMCLAIFASCSGKTPSSEEESSTENASAAVAVVKDYDKIKAAGKLVVGITDFAPIDFKDENNEWTGFDAEFARATAAKLGVDVEFIEIDWDNKFTELKGGTIDCIWNGMTITDEVTLNSDSTMPYVQNKQVIVMPADKLDQYPDIESMKDLTFAVEAGSAGESAAADAGLKTLSVAKQADTLLEVKAGTSDGAVIDLTMATAMTGVGTSYENLAKGVVLTDELYGVAFRQGSDLTKMVNDIMIGFAQDGTLSKLSEKYGLSLSPDLLKYVSGEQSTAA